MSLYQSDNNSNWKYVQQDGQSKIKKLGSDGEYDYYKWDNSKNQYVVSREEKQETRWDAVWGDRTYTVYEDPYDADVYVEPAQFTSDLSSLESAAGTALTKGGGLSRYTYTDGRFDPTSEEFKETAEENRMSDLLQGFGITDRKYWDYFDDPDMAQHDLIEQGYDLKESKIGTDTASALGNVKEQGQNLIKKMNFASGGDQAISEATGGVWQEYLAQKEAFDLDKKTEMKSFWDAEEDAFYDQLEKVETMIDA